MEARKGQLNLLSRRCRGLAPGAAALFFLAAAGASAQTESPERISILGVKNSFVVSAANDAYALALQKLAHPHCQLVFRDFRDPKGRTLQSRLEALDHTGPSFLQILRFANGEHLEPCQSRGVLAATTPLSHVIFLCGIQFFEKEHRDPEFAAALVIHEMLHSLGLGENPPTSQEITAKVLERCGAQADVTSPEATARLMPPGHGAERP
jgi:hypothetical protein